jgi:bla regulator protein BlaR1
VETLLDTVRVLGGTLLHFLWQGALIGLIAAGVLRAASRRPARDRYLICLGALLACAAAPLITAFVLLDRPATAVSAGTVTVNVQPGQPETIARSIGSWFSADMLHWVVGAWLLGVLSIATYYALQWRGVWSVRRSALPLTAPTNLAAAAKRLLGQWQATVNVPLMISALVTSPIVIGVWRPMIVFPAATVARMPVADFEMILLHEMAHIIRRDTWTNALQVLLEILFFYHPAVHWLSRRARLERECACDDFVVGASGSAYRYARALTLLAGAHRHTPAVAMGATNGDLLPRLRYLAGECIDGDAFPRTPLQLGLLALLLVALWMHASLSQWQASNEAPIVRPAQEVAGRETQIRLRPAAPDPEYLNAARSSVSSETTSAPWTRAREAITAVVSPERADAGEAPVASNDVVADFREANARDAGAAPKGAHELDALPAPAMPAVEAAPAGAAISGEADRILTQALPVVVESATPVIPENLPVEPSLTATYSPAPDYPVRARLEGIEGTVSAVVRIAPDGRTKGLHIIDAQPLGVFEGNVRRALMRWRYEVPSGSAQPAEDLEVTYQLRFTLSGVASTTTGICATATASRTCLPR